jgi:hypothetical protein
MKVDMYFHCGCTFVTGVQPHHVGVAATLLDPIGVTDVDGPHRCHVKAVVGFQQAVMLDGTS